MSDVERELKIPEAHNPGEGALPQWHRPELQKISLRETLNHVGSGNDMGHSQSL